jgi:hypothetical protein
MNPTNPPKKRERGKAESVRPPDRFDAISATVDKAKN